MCRYRPGYESESGSIKNAGMFAWTASCSLPVTRIKDLIGSQKLELTDLWEANLSEESSVGLTDE